MLVPDMSTNLNDGGSTTMLTDSVLDPPPEILSRRHDKQSGTSTIAPSVELEGSSQPCADPELEQ